MNDEGDADIEATGNGTKEKEFKSVSDYIKDGGDKKAFQLTKEKFKAITKNLLYCNICLDEPCLDIEHIIEKAKDDKEFEKMLGEFKIKIGDLKKAYDMMDINYKEAYDSLIYRMSMYAQDSSIDGMEKFTKALRGLGRLEKNEVVTPDEIVEKMIDKLDKEDYEKADSILLVNEKQAEFFMGIYKKFGKKVAEKCKIVASSEIGMHLCEKMLKSIGVNNYINNIIDIGDVNGDGKYDIKDFLDMSNDDILKKNGGKKFDIVLMNPPYDAGHHLYMKFLDKVINISDNSITINPINFIFTKTDRGIHKQLRNSIHNCNLEIDEIDGNKSFKDASFLGFNLGICKFSKKIKDENVHINYLNGDSRDYISNSKEGINRADLSNDIVKSIIEKINNYNSKKIWDIFNFLPNYTGFGERNKIKEFKDNQLFVYLPIKTLDNINYAFFSNKKSKRNEVLTAGVKQTSGGIAVNSKKEGENIIKYLKTDIVRFCFYLTINGYDGGYFGFKLIPLIDFDNSLFNNDLSEINKKIYSEFKLSKKEINYIQNIINDYYNIRGN